jgi:hypothetical protein
MVIPMEKTAKASEEVLKIRRRSGFPPGSEFKFDTRIRPKAVTKEMFNEAKGAVLELAARHEMRFMTYVVLHKIAANRKLRDRALFALNTLLGEFDLFLSRETTSGICAIDRCEIGHSVLSSILAEVDLKDSGGVI